MAWRLVVLSSHAPLAALVAEHVEEMVPMEVVYYGSCYLCDHTATCRTRHVPSRADGACTLWHHPDEATPKAWLTAVEDVARRERDMAQLVMCFGLALCPGLRFDVLGIPRIQILCMNPLQGTPSPLAPLMLLDLRRRVFEDRDNDQIFVTNGVTRALLGYHAGADVAARVAVTTFFRKRLMDWSRAVPFGGASRSGVLDDLTVLLSSSFILQVHSDASTVSSVYLAFRLALQELLNALGFEMAEHRQDVFWTLQSSGDVAALTVYIPEHPYKNYFNDARRKYYSWRNDLYAMRLPIYLPSIDFIARFWPEVRSLDTAQCYDGWFDRRLPRTRLTEPSAESESPLPEPFDLSDGGYEKVRTWLAPADYFAFPGITIFQSLAQLHASLADLDDAHSSHLDAVREQMASFAVQRREEAAQLLSRVLRPVVSDASGG
ncbi:13 kDa deflagellation-inducible protein [Durusdinium trenchii]|uniref:13 kDa deflagellation-inducible protein n=1 Tax=Durusdinium trenchii TaxID=1381693 RepID=A0ABP0SI76_9DINO